MMLPVEQRLSPVSYTHLIVVNNKSPELVETLEQVERTTSDLQDLVMKIRMLPLDAVSYTHLDVYKRQV